MPKGRPRKTAEEKSHAPYGIKGEAARQELLKAKLPKTKDFLSTMYDDVDPATLKKLLTQLLFCKTRKELEKIVKQEYKDKPVPAIVDYIIVALQKGSSKGNFAPILEALKQIVDRMDYVESKPVKTGRPTLYEESFCQAVIEAGKEGKSPQVWAQENGFYINQVNDWADVHPEFSKAKKEAESQMASWYERTILKIALQNKSVNTTLLIWYGKNKCQWRDKKDIDVTTTAVSPVQNDPDYIEYLIHKSLSPGKQRDYVYDVEQFIVACGGRQCGKTYGMAMKLLLNAIKYPGCIQYYICAKARNLTEQLYSKILDFFEKHNLSLGKISEFDFVFTNGSRIKGMGLDNTLKLSQYIQGSSLFNLFVIDEAGLNRFYSWEDIYTVIGGMLGNVSQLRSQYGDTVCMQVIIQGNPWNYPGTLLEDIWASELPFKRYTWNSLEDIPQAIVDNKESARLWLAQHPGRDENDTEYKKMFLGIPGYVDPSVFLYPCYHPYPKDDFPKIQPDIISIGIDYGMSDFNAIIGVAWNRQRHEGYVFWETKFNRASIPTNRTVLEVLKSECMKLWKYALDMLPQYSDLKTKNKHILWWADSSDQGLTEEIKKALVLPADKSRAIQISNAHKQDKTLLHDLIRDLLEKGNLFIPEDGVLAQECERTIHLIDENNRVLPEIDDSQFHPDALDALRYAMAYILLKGVSK